MPVATFSIPKKALVAIIHHETRGSCVNLSYRQAYCQEMSKQSPCSVTLTAALVALALASIVTKVQGAVYIDALFQEKVFDSVVYFNFEETKWSYMNQNEILEGHVDVLTSSAFDEYFIRYQESGTHTTTNNNNNYYYNNRNNPSNYDNVDFRSTNVDGTTPGTRYQSFNDDGYQLTVAPTYLLVEFASSEYSSSIANIRMVAEWRQVDVVILIVSRNSSWFQQLNFWWSHEFPGVPTRQMAPLKNQGINGAVFMAVGSDQGQSILETLDQYRAWNLTDSEFYFGIDEVVPMKGSYFFAQFCGYLSCIILFWRWTKKLSAQLDQEEEEGHDPYVQFTGADLGMGEVCTSTTQHDCCVCLETMRPGEKVRILPCRHVFHHECIDGWFEKRKYNCPMCKMELRKHLEERRNANSELAERLAPPRSWRQRLWPWRKIESIDGNVLIGDTEQQEQALGHLELTEEAGVDTSSRRQGLVVAVASDQ